MCVAVFVRWMENSLYLKDCSNEKLLAVNRKQEMQCSNYSCLLFKLIPAEMKSSFAVYVRFMQAEAISLLFLWFFFRQAIVEHTHVVIVDVFSCVFRICYTNSMLIGCWECAKWLSRYDFSFAISQNIFSCFTWIRLLRFHINSILVVLV